MSRTVKICLDARLKSGLAGGVEQVIIGMAYGLSGLADGPEQFLFLTHPGWDDWLRPYVGGNCRFLYAPSSKAPASQVLMARFPLLRHLWDQFSPLLGGRRSFSVPKSDGTIERAGVHAMHFLHQRGFLTTMPSIYHPHDLQYVHLPENFTPRARVTTDFLMQTLCAQAEMVAVTSSWIAVDVATHFGLPGSKVVVVPWAPSIEAYPEPFLSDFQNAKAKFSLPEQFLFYPAQTFRHKNHLRLLEALAILRDEGNHAISLVCSGRQNDFYAIIKKRVSELGLHQQVHFLGFVSELELQCLYRMCRGVIIPTLYEAASFPLWEAFHAGAPVACSNVTSLPRQAGDAALIFDPTSPRQIAEAMRSLSENERLRRKLARKATDIVNGFSWEKTARTFRAHYRRILKLQLTAEDLELIQQESRI